jgi:hypothetical protein
VPLALPLSRLASYFTGRFSDRPLKVSAARPGVHSGGIQTLMSQQEGHLVERRSCINEVVGEGMMEGMRGAVLKASLISILSHEVVYNPLVEWISLPCEERIFKPAISRIA